MTFALLLLATLISYNFVLSGFHLYSGFSFSTWHCSPHLSIHLIFQGFALINFSLLCIWLGAKYYNRPQRTFQRVAAFAFFWTALKNDALLIILLLGLVFGIIWAIIGLVWLSKLDCEVDSREAVVSSIGAISFLLMVCLVLAWTVLLFALLACNEGSCTAANIGPLCFLCCCYPCIRQRGHDISVKISGRLEEARSTYPKQRNACLDKVTKGLVALGFLRPDLAVTRYTRQGDDSSIQELDGRVVPVTTGPGGENHPTANSEMSVLKPTFAGS